MNISKVVRTTRNDLAIGTAKGMLFVDQTPEGSLVPTKEKVMLDTKDITELSEYSHDRFIIGLWAENDYLLINRNTNGVKPEVIKEPLWCNNLCTDLVPLPGYHPLLFPYFLVKTLRSISLINFNTKKVHTLLEL
jgi:hypothetical protein